MPESDPQQSDAIESFVNASSCFPGDTLFRRLARAARNQANMARSASDSHDELRKRYQVTIARYALWAQTAANRLDTAINTIVHNGNRDDGLTAVHEVAQALRTFTEIQSRISGMTISDERPDPSIHRPLGVAKSSMHGFLPDELLPRGFGFLRLESGVVVPIPRSTPNFTPWQGLPVDRYGGKAVLDHGGKPKFAELVIVELLRQVGWQAVWVDSYRRAFRVDLPSLPDSKTQLPPPIMGRYSEIRRACGGHGGCWDVLAWNEDQILFCEAKLSNQDRIRASQLRWLDAALKCGLSPGNFLLVEWRLASPRL